MQRIDFKTLDKAQLASLPASWGVIALYIGEECQYIMLVSDIRKRVSYLMAQIVDEGSFSELMRSADFMNFEAHTSAIESLVAYKDLLLKTNPVLQQQNLACRDYVYLALSAYKYPFVKISELTVEDWNYIGPFRSRFFIAEMIDSISRILMLPHCETGDFPCSKFDDGRCRGWCLNLAPGEVIDETTDLKRLERILFETYMSPSDSVLKILQKEHDRYFNELEFEKADLFSGSIGLHQNYLDWLNFLIVAKELDYEDDLIVVKGGQLVSVFKADDSKWQSYPCLQMTYQPNEILALDKSLLDETKILYDYIKTRGDKHV